MMAASHVMMMGIMSEMDEEDACLIVDRGKPQKNVFATDEGIHDILDIIEQCILNEHHSRYRGTCSVIASLFQSIRHEDEQV